MASEHGDIPQLEPDTPKSPDSSTPNSKVEVLRKKLRMHKIRDGLGRLTVGGGVLVGIHQLNDHDFSNGWLLAAGTGGLAAIMGQAVFGEVKGRRIEKQLSNMQEAQTLSGDDHGVDPEATNTEP